LSNRKIIIVTSEEKIMATKPLIKRPKIEVKDPDGKYTVLRTRCLASADEDGWTQQQKDDFTAELDACTTYADALTKALEYFDFK
jgi:hypothetical protein